MNSDQSPPTASATLTVRPSLPEDVVYLAPRLRKEDLDSVLASGSPSADLSLIRGLVYSDLCMTAEDHSGTPVLMFGTVVKAKAQDRINSMPWASGPSPFAAALKIGGVGLDAYSRHQRTKQV